MDPYRFDGQPLVVVLEQLCKATKGQIVYNDLLPLNPVEALFETVENGKTHPLFKAVRCQTHEQMIFQGGCPKGDSCLFAHSEEELRILPEGVSIPTKLYLYELVLTRPNKSPLRFQNSNPFAKKSKARAEVAEQCLKHFGCEVTYHSQLQPGIIEKESPNGVKERKHMQVMLYEYCKRMSWTLKYDQRLVPSVDGDLNNICFSLTLYRDSHPPKTFHNMGAKSLKCDAKADVALQCKIFLGLIVSWTPRVTIPQKIQLESGLDLSKKQLTKLISICNSIASSEYVACASSTEEWLCRLGSRLGMYHPDILQSIKMFYPNLKSFVKIHGSKVNFPQHIDFSNDETAPEKHVGQPQAHATHLNFLMNNNIKSLDFGKLQGPPLQCVIDILQHAGAVGIGMKELKFKLQRTLNPSNTVKTHRLTIYLDLFSEHFVVIGEVGGLQQAYLKEIFDRAENGHTGIAEQAKSHTQESQGADSSSCSSRMKLASPDSTSQNAVELSKDGAVMPALNPVAAFRHTGDSGLACGRDGLKAEWCVGFIEKGPASTSSKCEVTTLLQRFGLDAIIQSRVLSELGATSIQALSFLEEEDVVQLQLLPAQRRGLSRAVKAAAEMSKAAEGSAAGGSLLGGGSVVFSEDVTGGAGPREVESKLDDSDIVMDPIKLEIMTDPVLAADGYTYERSNIEAWFRARGAVSMMTGAAVESTTLVPNKAVRDLVAARHPHIKLCPWLNAPPPEPSD